MKKGLFGIIMILSLLMVITAGCGDNNNPINLGPTPTPSPSSTPTPSPTPIQWPAATTDWLLSGATALSVDDTKLAFGTIETKSDTTNLYVKVTFDTVGFGQTFFLLIDDTSLTSGYTCSKWDTNFTTWTGSMGMTFKDFDADFINVQWRSWNDPNKGEFSPGYNHAITGPNEANYSDVTCTVDPTVGANPAYSSYEFTIPYSSIGKAPQAQSGDHIQIVALLGRETWQGAEEGTFINADPLGVQSAIPGDETTVKTDDGHPRIAHIEKYVLCTLK